MSMSTYTTDKASPFTRAVICSMRKLYPEALADKRFDNTGLLLEAPFDPIRRQMNSVLLTIDLTKAVADEAIERKDCVVVSYHPIIFKGFKALTLADTQQQSLLRLALEGISVYSPHTAVDAAPGGLGDWLADIVTGTLPGPEPATYTATEQANPKPTETEPDGEPAETNGDAFAEEEMDKAPEELAPSPRKKPVRPSLGPRRSTYSQPTYPKPAELEKTDLSPSALRHTRSVIHPTTGVQGFEGAGMGRLVKFHEPQPLTHLIERIAHGVGSPKGFPVAIPQTRQVEDITIRSVGICAGSGHEVLKNVEADLLFTGELSHHDALSATEKGRCVVTLFHSNTERGFLSSVLKERLTGVLKEEWRRVREEVKGDIDDGWDLANEWEDALKDEDVLVECSERDRDPFGIVILQSPQVGKTLGGG
ncbi:NGG1 interacting factor [Mycoblastus sanguinarius]|nr:NGG1 interacting factor [Mycoblastus sanguinarius]